MTTVVYGIGHPDRGDDAAGCLVAELLADSPHVRAYPITSDPAALLIDPDWAAADHVVLVDAIRTGAAPGTVSTLSPTTLSSGAIGGGDGTHDLGLATVFGLAAALDRWPADLLIIGIEGHSFGVGAAITPAVRRAAERVAAALDVDTVALDGDQGSSLEEVIHVPG